MTRLLFTFLSAIIFCSCHIITGSGNIITETRPTGPFNGVKTSGSIDVEVINNANRSVTIEADDNVLPYIFVTVEDGLLDVHYKSKISFNNSHVKVYVSAPFFDKLFVIGSGNIISKSTLKNANGIEFKVSGSGDIDVVVDAPKITANVGGSGTITLQGRTKNFSCSIGGSGDIKSGKLLSENTNATISGSGTAHIFASVHLVSKVSGSGDIFYSGNATSAEIHTSGSGTIEAEK